MGKTSNRTVLFTAIALMLLLIIGGIPISQAPSNDVLGVVQTANGQEEILREEAFIKTMSQQKHSDVWNPFSPYSPWDNGVRQMNEFLFYHNFYNGSTIPWLATGWDVNEDKTEWTINIREGAKWSDGTSFTAHDVVFTLEMLRDNPALSYPKTVVRNVTSITANGDYKVEITLSVPNAHYIWDFVAGRSFLFIAPKHKWEAVDDYLLFNNSNPVFTSAFKLVESKEEQCIWQRDDNWWGKDIFGLPAMKWIVYKYVGTQDKAELAIQANEIDTVGSTKAIYDELSKTNEYLTYIWGLDPAPRYIKANLYKYPMNLNTTRWAISYGIDRSKLVALREGLAKIAYWTQPMYAAAEPFATWDLWETYNTTEYNPAKAEAILVGMGCTKGGDGIYVTANGTRMSFTLNAVEGLKSTIETIAADLDDVGIEIIPKYVSIAEQVQGIITNVGIELNYWWQQAPMFPWDPWAMWRHYYGKDAYPLGATGDIYGNPQRYNNTEFDAIFDEATMYTSDTAEFKALHQQLMYIYLQDLPKIPLISDYSQVIVNEYWWENWPTSDPDPTALYTLPHSAFPFDYLLYFGLTPSGRTSEVPADNTMLYIGGAVVAIVIIAAIFFLRRR
jgi:peptide/nickel transport system substrate-binding protein